MLRRLTPLMCLLTCVNSAFAATAPERPPMLWKAGSWGLSATSEYFMSNANYDDSRGGYQRLPNDNSLSSFEARFKGRYGLTRRISLYSGLGVAQVRTIDPINEKTNTNPTEFFFGANFQIWKKWVRVVPEVEVSIPLDKTSPGQTTPLTSDGVTYLRAGFFFLKPIRRFTVDGYLGAHVPAEGLAKRLVYNLSAELPIAEEFTLGGGVAGYESVMGDEITYTERARTTNLASVGSQRFWAYSPAVLEARAWVGFRPGSTYSIRAGYARTLNGIRTSEGQSLLLSFIFHAPQGRSVFGEDEPMVQTTNQQTFTRNKKADTDRETFEESRTEVIESHDFEADDTEDENLNETEKMMERR